VHAREQVRQRVLQRERDGQAADTERSEDRRDLDPQR